MLHSNFVKKNQLKTCSLSASIRHAHGHLFVSKKPLPASLCASKVGPDPADTGVSVGKICGLLKRGVLQPGAFPDAQQIVLKH